jgi:histidyl-tRNA synthetase
MSRNKKSSTIQAPQGVRDIVPEDQKYWRYIYRKAELLLEDYSFEKIDTPLFESSELLERVAGDDYEEVKKEVLMFKAKDGQEIAVRNDSLASLIRAYLENGMQTRPHPVRLYSTNSTFKGMQEARQINIETLGDDSEVIDAELVFLGYKLLDGVGFKDYNVHINTMGDQNCRPAYVRALRDFYKSRIKKVCAVCRDNLKLNPIKLIECQEEVCKEVALEAPQMIDYLDEACKAHFKHILEFLDLAKVPYLIRPNLVSSAEHTTRTIFEFMPDEGVNSPSVLISGSRHDKLVETIGGPKTPSAGWYLDLDKLVAALKDKNANVPDVGIKPKVFLVQLGDAAKRKSLLLFEDIRRSGIEVKYSISRDSIKSQLRIAARYGVRFTLIFGQKEAIEGTVILREMETGIQETIPLEKIIDEVKKRLKK